MTFGELIESGGRRVVAQIIAEKVCGWRKEREWIDLEEEDPDLRIDGDWCWTDGGKRQAWVNDDWDGQRGFDPLYSLDDCYLFEEKIKPDENLWQEYVNNLMRELLEIRHVIHATSMQKCHAVLLAFGVILNNQLLGE